VTSDCHAGSYRAAEVRVPRRPTSAAYVSTGYYVDHLPAIRALPILGTSSTYPREFCSGVGLDVLHNDDDLPVRTLRDGVPDSQTVRWQVETVRTRQRVYLGKRVGKCRNWFFEQLKGRPTGGVSKRLRQSFELVPGPVRETKNPVTH
jgi:hypothetical protein